MADCKAGKIDLIVTKKVARFSRNIVNTLRRARELKDMGIGIIFERDHLNTLEELDEQRLVYMALYAENEAKATSDYCKMAIRRRFQKGIPMPTRMYGYQFVEDSDAPKSRICGTQILTEVNL